MLNPATFVADNGRDQFLPRLDKVLTDGQAGFNVDALRLTLIDTLSVSGAGRCRSVI